MILDTIIAILSSSALTAAITWGGKIYYEKLKKKRKEENHINTLKGIISLYDDIHSILKETEVERVIIFKTHNGNGRPSINKPYKVSALYGDSLVEDRKGDYQNLLVDKKYTELLLAIWDSNKPYRFVTEEEPDSLLKTIYEGEGVTQSQLYFIEMVRTGMIYASFGKYDNKPLSKKDQLRVSMVVMKWKHLFLNDKYVSLFSND